MCCDFFFSFGFGLSPFSLPPPPQEPKATSQQFHFALRANLTCKGRKTRKISSFVFEKLEIFPPFVGEISQISSKRNMILSATFVKSIKLTENLALLFFASSNSIFH
jgi:hypothetical protein